MLADDDLSWLVSVDDHLFEAPDAWTSAAPASIRDRVPHVVQEDGVDTWVYEDVRTSITGALVQAGRPTEAIDPGPVNYADMLPAYYDPLARVDAMNQDGVLASLCFPFFPRFCGQTFYEADDKELAAWCVRRYNDWVIDEWAGAAPGRFIPLIILPLWDPAMAAGEIERCAAKGAKAISFSENPSKLGLPSMHDRTGYWDPIFSTAADAGLPLAIHFGSSSSIPTTSPDAPIMVSGALSPINLAYCLTDWIFSGYFERYENLKILLSEGGIGWIPYALERMDYVFEHHHAWTGAEFDGLRPSDVYRRNIITCFIDDA
ncbi:MAG TPA: amidohydrolase family protein, partial [Iamia sp.]|nr:amidohydrolase family protein [Iamia sp.]